MRCWFLQPLWQRFVLRFITHQWLTSCAQHQTPGWNQSGRSESRTFRCTLNFWFPGPALYACPSGNTSSRDRNSSTFCMPSLNFGGSSWTWIRKWEGCLRSEYTAAGWLPAENTRTKWIYWNGAIKKSLEKNIESGFKGVIQFWFSVISNFEITGWTTRIGFF